MSVHLDRIKSYSRNVMELELESERPRPHKGEGGHIVEYHPEAVQPGRVCSSTRRVGLNSGGCCQRGMWGIGTLTPGYKSWFGSGYSR